jgi:hypothetical protein
MLVRYEIEEKTKSIVVLHKCFQNPAFLSSVEIFLAYDNPARTIS